LIDKRKLHFLELTFLFGIVTLMTLLYEWGYSRPGEKGSEMMSGSMGSMMLSMHGRGATLADIIQQEEVSDTNADNDAHESHHSSSYLSSIHYITTMTIIVLLPLIIAGSIFLAIVWIK